MNKADTRRPALASACAHTGNLPTPCYAALPYSQAYYSKRFGGLGEDKAGMGARPLVLSGTLLFSPAKLLIII